MAYNRPAQAPRTPLTDLAATFALTGDSADVVLTGIEHRAQHVQPGDLFVALAGAKVHGAEFGSQATAAGATAILTDPAGAARLSWLGNFPVLVHPEPRAILGPLASAIYGNPSRKLDVIGVTGTSGKTTTSYFIEGALAAAARTPGLIGTVETRINGEVLPSSLTTPEAPQLQALLALMLERGCDSVVMEVSSHALVLNRVDGTQFSVGAFTNLSQDHFDFHKGFEDYFAAKARLFEPNSAVCAQRAVVCVDDSWGMRMAAVAGPGVRTVSRTRHADWSAAEIVASGGGQQFSLTDPSGIRTAIAIALPGEYNVANAALALAAVAEVGVDIAAAATGLANVGVPGRLERVDAGQDYLALVDYAHKPGAIEAVLATLRAQSSGRIAIVIGAGGDRDSAKRPLMGSAAAAGAELVIVTDDNPRTEDPALIRAAVVSGARELGSAAEIREISDRGAAIQAAVDWARPGDIVLVAGKGHEQGQEINGTKHPFSDRAALTEAIRARVEAS